MLIRDAVLKKTILEAMADECSLAILKGTTDRARSAMEIVHECGLPPSSVYRRISDCQAAGLLTVERIVVTDGGKKYSLYRSTVSDIRAEYKAGDVELNVSFNEDVVAKLSRLWASMRVER